MKKHGTLIFVLIAIGLTIAVFAYLFFTGKIGHKKGKGNPKNNGGGNINDGNIDATNNTYIGRDAYASRNGVKVYNADQSVYKTAAIDDWVGKVYSSKVVHIPGKFDADSNTWSGGVDIQAYILGSNQYAKFVDKNDVYLQ